MDVHLAAEGFEVESLVGIGRHKGKYSAVGGFEVGQAPDGYWISLNVHSPALASPPVARWMRDRQGQTSAWSQPACQVGCRPVH
jgi:hypothetical protein